MKKIFNKIALIAEKIKNFICAERTMTVIFYTLLFLCSAAVALKSKNYDFDMWARLIAGMAIVQTGHVAKFDFYSYTPTHAWYDHEWGSSVVFYLVNSTFGHLGLLFLQVLLVFLTMFFLVKTVQVRCADKYNYKNLLIYFIILNSFMVTYSSMIRCHSFTFMFFAFELFILELIRKNGNYKLLYIFPPLFLIWGNMHGGVCSGLGLLALYAIGEALNKKQYKYYIYTALACFATLFINPYGYKYVIFLIKAATMPRPDIVEWWWIFHKYNYKIFMVFKLSALFYLLLELTKVVKYPTRFATIDKTKFIVMLVTLYLAISHVKMMPFFALTATAYCYEDIYLMFKNFHFPKWCMPALYLALFGYSVGMLSLHDYRLMVNFKTYPVMEVEFIRANHISGKLLTNFGIGSFAAYKLYPQNRVYMDGRYEEVYNEDLMQDLSSIYTIDENFSNLFRKNMPEIIILEKGYPLYNILQQNGSGWNLAFKGINYGVFVCDAKYRPDFEPPSADLKDYYKNTILNTMITFKGENKIDIDAVNRGEYTTIVPAELLEWHTPKFIQKLKNIKNKGKEAKK